jgi:hypothetical protein
MYLFQGLYAGYDVPIPAAHYCDGNTETTECQSFLRISVSRYFLQIWHFQISDCGGWLVQCIHEIRRDEPKEPLERREAEWPVI